MQEESEGFLWWRGAANGGMHMGELSSRLANAFAVRGFGVSEGVHLEGRSGDIHPAALLAEKEGTAILLEVSATVGSDEVRRMAHVRDDVGAGTAILAHLGPVDPDAVAAAAQENLVLWDAATISRLVGEAAVAPLVGGSLAPMPLEAPGKAVATNVFDLLPPAFQAAEVPTVMGVIAEPSVLEAFPPLAGIPAPRPPPRAAPALPWTGTSLEPFPPLSGLPAPLEPSAGAPAVVAPVFAAAPAAAPTFTPSPFAAPAVAVAPQASLRAGHPVQGLLGLKVGAQDAARRVHEHLFSVDVQELVLQPVHLFDYECDLFAEGSLKVDCHEGRLQVHGTDKRTIAIDMDELTPGEPATAPDAKIATKALRVSPERALELAREKIIEIHTRLVDYKLPQESHSFYYVEKRKLAPRPEHIRIRPQGAWYRPLWRMSGTNGEMTLDAVTGAIVERQLRTNPDVFVLE
ncbi:MAG: restriction endonuclease [Thermoplasmatota archaeon]